MARQKITPIKAALLGTSDEKLCYHLEQAEDHLIQGILLFEEKDRPDRDSGYRRRLTRAQETVTGLYGEELVRKRGLVRDTRSKKRK